MTMSLRKTALLILALLASHLVNAQSPDHKDHPHRTCSTMEVLERQNQENPQLAAKREALERDVQQYLASRPAAERTSATVITIPVVVHVVYNTSTENISDAQIQSQIDILNADFNKLNSDASLTPPLFSGVASSCDIQFCLAKRTPTGVSTSGITRTFTSVTAFIDDDKVKFASSGGADAWDATKYLNIWVCNLGDDLLGYAQFPGGPVATDGVVCGHFCFGNTGTAQAPFNKGRTATHEIGHWLNLRHIWGDANCGNDLVADTPTQQDANTGCPNFPQSTCSNTSDMFMNYMDYTNDACMYMFTAGQVSRMRASITNSRSGLLTSDGCTPSSIYCTGLITSVAPSGTISDGSMSSNYNNNSDCQWKIQPAGATSITLTFTTFATEATNDVVTVYNGTSTSGTVVGTYSGNTLPSSLTVTGSAVFVTFVSNGSVTDAGWSFNYTSVIPVTNCSGLSTYTASSGTINDGSGANDYPSNSNCQFLIQPAGSGTITINFTQFATELTFDRVRVYDGSDATATLLGTYSGTSLPPTLTTTGAAAYITFTSDATINNSGWSLNYLFNPMYCAGQPTLTASNGSFTDGSAADNYYPNSNCKWLIQPSVTAQSIAISFSDFETESGWDFVRIYQGTSTSGVQVAQFSGTSLPGVTTVSGPSAYVVFTSDNSINYPGWTLNYTSVAAGVVSTLDGDVEVFPNPAEDLITIKVQLRSSSAMHCKVLNAYGQSVWEKSFSQADVETSANIANLPSGMYYVQVTDAEGRTKVEKIVKK